MGKASQRAPNHFLLGVQGMFFREDVPLEHLKGGDICTEYRSGAGHFWERGGTEGYEAKCSTWDVARSRGLANCHSKWIRRKSRGRTRDWWSQEEQSHDVKISHDYTKTTPFPGVCSPPKVFTRWMGLNSAHSSELYLATWCGTYLTHLTSWSKVVILVVWFFNYFIKNWRAKASTLFSADAEYTVYCKRLATYMF